MEKKLMFERLVENACDFLSKAVNEFNDQPKYSVINLHTSIGLFIKARLMAEHWTLVVAKQKDLDWGKFIAGDFQSVSINEAANRLDKVVRSPLPKGAIKVFREVTKHRNKMVHFFHEALSKNTGKDNKLKQDIVKQQLKAWYFLHKLITKQWKGTFKPWSKKITRIDRSVRKLPGFLQVVFDNLQDEIKKLKARKAHRTLFNECPSCHFESQQHDGEKGVVYVSECMVCKLKQQCLQIECPDCGFTIIFENEGFASCKKCNKDFEPDDIANILVDHEAAFIAAKDGDDSFNLGNCSSCEGYHTVVSTKNDTYLCANCFEEFESLQTCGWCSEPNTGEMEDSSWMGCNFCDGSYKNY